MLYNLYADLREVLPRDEAVLMGAPVAEGNPAWLAVDRDGFPALLLPAKPGDARPDIQLRAVEVAFSRACEVQAVGGQPHCGCYSIIRLKENDPDIVRLFAKILEERFCHGPPPRNNSEIAENIQEVAALFSRTAVTKRDVVGLWGELYAISQSGDLEAAVRSWSAQKSAKYDFVTETFVLDVKTTLAALPKHRFSLEQVRPTGAYEAYILSLCLAEVQGGQTVGVLIDTIDAKIVEPELRSAFLRQCLIKGGSDIYRSELPLLPYPDGEAMLLFQARDIPAPGISEGDPIDNVRFDVNLSSVSALSNSRRREVLLFK